MPDIDMPITTRDRLIVISYLVFNVVSVVGVVALNKTLYNPPYNFKFPSSLMVFHFMCTWMFVALARRLGWFESKRIDFLSYLKLGAAQTASVGFVNLSLMHNSVGMYQLLKFTNVLVIAAMEFFWKGKTYTVPIYLSLVALVGGVTAATVTDVYGTAFGIVLGCVASVSTAVYQILNKSIQSEHEVSALQLLEYEQPLTIMWSTVFALLTDNVTDLSTYSFTSTSVGWLLLSGVFAFGVNVTCYLIIGKTSPVTYSVVGHTKTIGILLFGFFVVRETMNLKTFLGLGLAFAGIVSYTHLTSARSKAAAEKAAAICESQIKCCG